MNKQLEFTIEQTKKQIGLSKGYIEVNNTRIEILSAENKAHEDYIKESEEFLEILKQKSLTVTFCVKEFIDALQSTEKKLQTL